MSEKKVEITRKNSKIILIFVVFAVAFKGIYLLESFQLII